MFNLQQGHFIIYILLAMHGVWYGVAGGWLLYHHKQQRDRSRIFVGCYFLYLAYGACTFILTALFRRNPDVFLHTILEPYPIMLSFLANVLTIAYLAEVLHPHWLTLKRFVLAILPWLVLSVAWIIYHAAHGFAYDAITRLSDVTQILPHIHQTDVWLRVLLLSCHLLYLIILPFIRYNWQTSNVSKGRITWLKFLVMICIVGFVFGMGLRIPIAIIIYLGLLDILSVSVFVTEMRNRIPVPQSVTDEQRKGMPTADLSDIAHRLQVALSQGIWANPDISRDDVCRLIGTNRTYLSSAIHELGYDSFTDMINHYRTRFIHDQLQSNPDASLSDLFFRAGYRNRSTAVHYFTQIYHYVPSTLTRQKKDGVI